MGARHQPSRPRFKTWHISSESAIIRGDPITFVKPTLKICLTELGEKENTKFKVFSF
jgi:hypothetical protein